MPDLPIDRRASTSWPWFAAWLLVGAGLAFGLLGALSVGALVLQVTALATVAVVRTPVAQTDHHADRPLGGAASSGRAGAEVASSLIR